MTAGQSDLFHKLMRHAGESLVPPSKLLRFSIKFTQFTGKYFRELYNLLHNSGQSCKPQRKNTAVEHETQ